MPELPEVEALAADLRERAVGRVIDRADIAEFSVLKTYDPPLTALRGDADRRYRAARQVPRPHRRLRPTAAGPLHLVTHLARAGWLRWREELPEQPPRPGKGPLAFRLRFTDGSGFDLTEAGTRKRLAVYLVTDIDAIPGVASLGPEPLDADFTPAVLARDPGRAPHPDQGRAAGPEAHRRDR